MDGEVLLGCRSAKVSFGGGAQVVAQVCRTGTYLRRRLEEVLVPASKNENVGVRCSGRCTSKGTLYWPGTQGTPPTQDRRTTRACKGTVTT